MTNLLKKSLFLSAVLFAQLGFSQSHAAGNEAMQLEDWDRAIAIFSGLTQANPGDQSAFLSLGNAFLAKGDKANAEKNFKSAFDAKSDAPMAFVANGRILLLQNKTAEAEKQFAKAKKYAKKADTSLSSMVENYLKAVASEKKVQN